METFPKVIIDFGGFLPLDVPEGLFIGDKGSFTPAYVGRDYEEHNSLLYDPVYSKKVRKS